MLDRDKLKKYLEDGQKAPPIFEMVNGSLRFQYPGNSARAQFETCDVWMKIVPVDEKNPERIEVECLVPHCGDTVAVAYLNSPLSITNWISHTFNNHPHVLTEADYDKSSETGAYHWKKRKI